MTIDASEVWPQQVAIVGVGLLGGSVALATARARPGSTIIGYARSREKAEQLQQSGIVHRVATSIAELSETSDVIVLATPVDRIAPLAIEAAAAAPDDCLITDVGSTKATIVQAVSADPRAAKKFVAAHPIAGSEKSGYQHATETLLRGKVVVLTPSAGCDEDLLKKAESFWSLTGGVICQMSPGQHDAHLAAVSHVPHLVSALVAKMTEMESLPLVGSGWRDITRVAAGDPAMWTAICQENRAAISHELARFSDQLQHLRQIIDTREDDVLMSWLTEAQRLKQQTS